MAEPAARLYTYEEYLEIERASEIKHEFIDGHVLAMAGGKPNHALLAMNIAGPAFAALRGGSCRLYSSDLRVRVPESGLATYPDLTVVCGPFEAHPEDPDACTNPVLLVEVLSESTEAYDRGEKFAHYRRLASLRDYLLVAHDRVFIEHFSRDELGTWRLAEAGPGQSLEIGSIGATISVDEVYDGVELAPVRRRGT